jgi:hypothetical protein
MLTAPKVPLVYRVITFSIALAIGLCTLELYELGGKFVTAMTNYTRLAAQNEVDKAAKARRAAIAEQQRFKEPGVVGVQIIDPDKKK